MLTLNLGIIVFLKKNTFNDANISFTGTIFNAGLSFGGELSVATPTIVNGHITFQGCVISTNSIVRIFGINCLENISGNIKFDNAIIKGFLDIRNVYLKHITFNGTVVTGNIQDNNTLLPSIQDRNTARLLKHEAKKINNNISASNYFQIEMSIYNKSLKSWNLNDRILLGLNQLSNKHGLSWSRGAFFTILFGLLFYSLFIMSRDGFGFFWNNNWDFLLNNESFWAGFINFFWLPTGFNQLIDKTSTYMFGGGIGAGFFILGKITIAYGIYQTISAFRKYF